MGDYYTEDFLMHHGVKGQKWGVKNLHMERIVKL